MPSRHDHYPRSDSARRRALHAREVALESALRSADQHADGIAAQIARLAAARATPDQIFAALEPRLSDLGWLRDRLAALCSMAASDDFAMPPVRIFNGALGGLILAEAPPITLSLMIRPFDQAPPAGAPVIFALGHGMTRIVKSGGARLRRYRVALSAAEKAGGFRASTANPCEFVGESALADGDIIRADQQCESFHMTGGDGDLVMLQIFVQAPSRVAMREYDPVTGQLVRLAAAGRATSFRQMGLAVLRAFGRRDAVPLFASALQDPDFAMRWQVMREFIALDPLAALPELAAMAAGDPHPEVRAAAGQTLRIVREHLAKVRPPLEEMPCPM